MRGNNSYSSYHSLIIELGNLRNDISREFGNIRVTVATDANNPNLIHLKKNIDFQSYS